MRSMRRVVSLAASRSRWRVAPPTSVVFDPPVFLPGSRRAFSSAATTAVSTASPTSGGRHDEDDGYGDQHHGRDDDGDQISRPHYQRVWRAEGSDGAAPRIDVPGNAVPPSSEVVTTWSRAVDECGDRDRLDSLLDRIGAQEREGGRMLTSQLGVIREDPAEDMRLLIENYTVPALASALRDREDVLQYCAYLLEEGRLNELSDILRPYGREYIQAKRHTKDNTLDLVEGFDTPSLELLRKGLMRMPRRVSQAHQRRAGVVLPLCNVHGVPCVLFEKRSRHLRAHPDEVCLPGGMVSEEADKSIVSTCLREMSEEILGIDPARVTVLGVLRCNWGEVHHLVGVAVTPVVCFIGEIGTAQLQPNPDEVAEVFTVPLESFLDRERWVRREDFAPIFTGGPHIIWGLTGYIVNRFVKDILARYNVDVPCIK